MQFEQIINDIITEVSYRSKEGIVDFKNPEHISILSEILDELDLSEIKNELFHNLFEADVDDEKYTHQGAGIYVRKGDEDREGAKRYTKSDDGKYQAISDDEYEKIKAKQGDSGEKAAAGSSQNQPKVGGTTDGGEQAEPQRGTSINPTSSGGVDYIKSLSDADVAKQQAIKQGLVNDTESESDNDNETKFSEDDTKTIDDFKSRIEKSTMSAEAKSEAVELVDKLSVIFDKSKSKDEVMETLSSMNISISSNRKKLYLDDMRKYGGGLYKILGDGTKGAITSINKISEYMELPEDDNKMSIEIEAAAKPDLGSQNIRSVYKKSAKGFTNEVDDVNVEKLFQTPPLDRIDTTKFKSLFGPTDDNGNLLTPSSKHSKEYLKFSIKNNVSVDNTIKVLEKYASEGKISPDLANSVKAHKQRLNGVLEGMEIPSEEAANAVDESYARMFDELMKQNQDLASRMLKQFAEMRLYDSEIAKGDEAYLPGDGSFPAGDKLVFKNGAGGTERVSFVSVKYGKSGDVYGCPANSKALQTLHPDVNKRNRQGQYIGEGGYTLAVNDELISDKETTKSTIKSMIGEMPDIQGVFSEEEIDKISNVVTETKDRVNQLKARYEKDGKMDKVGWAKLQKDLLKDPTMVELNTKLKEVVSVEKFSKIIGSRNGRVAEKYDFGAAHFMSGLSFANQVVTSNGYEGVTHNKQYYDNGTLKNTTVAGTTDRDEWYINFRMYKTAGRGGGGAQISYIGSELKEKYGDSQIGELR